MMASVKQRHHSAAIRIPRKLWSLIHGPRTNDWGTTDGFPPFTRQHKASCTSQRTKGVLVLAAIDALDDRRDYERVLRSRGYEVIFASSGLECLDKLRSRRPDVLVLSTRLLWGGAAGVLALLREDDDLPRVPVVLLTPTDGSDDADALAPPVVSHLRIGASRSEFVRHVMLAVLRAADWNDAESASRDSADRHRPIDECEAAAEQLRWCLGGTFDADDVRCVLQNLEQVLAHRFQHAGDGGDFVDVLEAAPERSAQIARCLDERDRLQQALATRTHVRVDAADRIEFCTWFDTWNDRLRRLRERERLLVMDAVLADLGVGD